MKYWPIEIIFKHVNTIPPYTKYFIWECENMHGKLSCASPYKHVTSLQVQQMEPSGENDAILITQNDTSISWYVRGSHEKNNNYCISQGCFLISERKRYTKEAVYKEVIWTLECAGIYKNGTLFSALNPRSWITQMIMICKSVYIVDSSVQINICWMIWTL